LTPCSFSDLLFVASRRKLLQTNNKSTGQHTYNHLFLLYFATRPATSPLAFAFSRNGAWLFPACITAFILLAVAALHHDCPKSF